MVGTKSHGYSNSGQLSEGEYSVPFFSTHPSPSSYTLEKIVTRFQSIKSSVETVVDWVVLSAKCERGFCHFHDKYLVYNGGGGKRANEESEPFFWYFVGCLLPQQIDLAKIYK